MESKGLLCNKWFFWTLFIILFGYAIVRAWTVVPMLDEIATFYSYIRTGHYFNTIELVDANNHVLNSFFAHQFYRLFGDHFFLFRLSSLLAFPVYFFSLKFIAQTSIPKRINTVVFLSLVCIPWIFEYFSYSRGYGMAIAGYFGAIAMIVKWKQTRRGLHFALIFLALFVSVASSLTYLMPSMLIFLYVALLLILERKEENRKGLKLGVMFAWMLALVPFVRYSFELKAAGALWWGNQDGLWESTGKSLSRLVLFSEATWILYIISFFLLFGLISFILNWTKKGLWTYIKETEAMVFLVLIGALTGIVLMRYVFDVNYPMDRVGMFLVPLFILFLGLVLSAYQFSKYALLGLIFFPISFLLHANISTSIFSPEDRIPLYLSNQIKSKLSDETALSAEYVSHMSYAYSCRNDERVHMAYTADKESNLLSDYHIDWLGIDTIAGYTTVTQDPESHTNFLQRRNPVARVLIADTIVENITTSEMYMTVFKEEIDSVYASSLIQCEITANMDFSETTRAFNFIRSVEDEVNNPTSTSNPRFDWYFSDRTDVHFSFVDRPFQLTPNDQSIHVFFMNADLRQIDVDFIRVRLYEIRPETTE